jgi:hypothetical protein
MNFEQSNFRNLFSGTDRWSSSSAIAGRVRRRAQGMPQLRLLAWRVLKPPVRWPPPGSYTACTKTAPLTLRSSLATGGATPYIGVRAGIHAVPEVSRVGVNIAPPTMTCSCTCAGGGDCGSWADTSMGHITVSHPTVATARRQARASAWRAQARSRRRRPEASEGVCDDVESVCRAAQNVEREPTHGSTGSGSAACRPSHPWTCR